MVAVVVKFNCNRRFACVLPYLQSPIAFLITNNEKKKKKCSAQKEMGYVEAVRSNYEAV